MLLLALVAGYFYLYQGHRDISKEKALFQISSENLVNEFRQDAASANARYLNQTIEVNGRISEVTDSTLILEPGVFCTFSQKLENGLKEKEVTIKGRCIGFDDLFEEVKFDQCTFKQTK